MKRLIVVAALVVAVAGSAQAAGWVNTLLMTGPAATRPSVSMAAMSALPTPEIVGLAANAGKPTVLWLDVDRQVDLPIIWRSSDGQIVKCPFMFNVSAFADDGKLRDVQVKGKDGYILRLTTPTRSPQWITIVVQCHTLGLSWARSAWVSWGDYNRVTRTHENLQHNEQVPFNVPNPANAVNNSVGTALNAP